MKNEDTERYFLIHKNWMRKEGERERRLYKPEEIEKAIEKAKKYAAENGRDYYLVKVVEEIQSDEN